MEYQEIIIKGIQEYCLVNGGKFYESVGPLIDFQLTVYYICTVAWKKFASNVRIFVAIA